MATLREATAAVADLLGRPVATVNTRALRLRGARLVPVEGRGLNAAHLDARHLVRLLLAAMLPDSRLADVVARVKKLDRLRHDAGAMQQIVGILSKRAPEDVVADFAKVENLGKALVRILKYFQRGTTAEEIGMGLVDFSIHISKDEVLAGVRLAWVDPPDENFSLVFGKRKPQRNAPLMTSVTVGPEVFEGLAKLMQGTA